MNKGTFSTILILLFLLNFELSSQNINAEAPNGKIKDTIQDLSSNFITFESILLDKNKLRADSVKYFPNNSIFCELLGTGLFYSINYERAFYTKNKNAIFGRIGFSYNPFFPSQNMFIYPMLINYHRSLKRSVYFEAGIGGTYLHCRQFNYNRTHDRISDNYYISGNLGFRFLIARHFLMKIDLTPSIQLAGKLKYRLPVFVGLSLGYSWGGVLKKTKPNIDFNSIDFIPKNCVDIEIFGNGYTYSLNYSGTIFHKKRNSINFRIGISYCMLGHSYTSSLIFDGKYFNLILPILLNYQYKLSSRSFFETGLGTRFIYNDKHVYKPHYYFDFIGNIGVKFLITKHFSLKYSFTLPIILYRQSDFGYNSIPQYFGLSIGYSW